MGDVGVPRKSAVARVIAREYERKKRDNATKKKFEVSREPNFCLIFQSRNKAPRRPSVAKGKRLIGSKSGRAGQEDRFGQTKQQQIKMGSSIGGLQDEVREEIDLRRQVRGWDIEHTLIQTVGRK